LPERAQVSISQITTLTSSFGDDVDTYRRAELDAIGIWELKLGEGSDTEALERLEASGLGRASAVPLIPSILPLPLMDGPDDPSERVDAICASLHRLAAFRPGGVVCLTGPAQGRDEDEAREIVVDGLRTIGDEAERAGVRVGLEPVNRVGGENWTIVSSIAEAVELLEAASRPSLGIQFDSWHLWNTETLYDDIARECRRFVGVHIADWREPTRSWADRVLPGDGAADVPAIVGALDRADWNGYYDVEIFSDNGTFGHAWPDSLWDLPAEEVVRRGKEQFERVWEERAVQEVIVTGRSADETG
jgi:sugar phosphate isomerase/epimerase